MPLPALHLSISACPSQSTALNDDKSRGRSRARLHGACHAASALKQTTPFAMQHTTAHHSSAEQSLNRIHSLAQTKRVKALLWPNRKSESPIRLQSAPNSWHSASTHRIASHRIAFLACRFFSADFVRSAPLINSSRRRLAFASSSECLRASAAWRSVSKR